MNIMLIGSGGREHALAWKIRQSPLVDRLICAPGNAGIGELAELVPVKATDLHGLLTLAREQEIDLTVVGPEQPLVDGIADLFNAQGMRIFGPSKAAAMLEGSKAFAKSFMQRHHIPTADFRSFTYAERFEAERFINELPAPIVLKADGLAAGKGVAICETKEKAVETLDAMMEQKAFGDAGLRVVVEEFLIGEEVSIFAVTDGKNYLTLPSAQDHKRVLDNDLGKNTGGMGAYAPAPALTEEILERVKRDIIHPTLAGMAEEGNPYVGVLYVGLMLTETGPKVVEFNCRLGDPETQAVIPLLDSDLVQIMADVAGGSLHTGGIRLKPATAVCVVVASGGYPDSYETGKEILGIDAAMQEEGVIVFHAGTKNIKHTLVSSGGRVLGVTAIGGRNDLEGTIDKAYRAVEKITFDGAYYRSDIGKKGVDRLRAQQKMELS